MGKLWRGVAWTGAVLAVLLAAYLVIGSVVTARVLTRVLTVSAEQPQAPPSENPFDLGYRGDPGQAFGYAFQSVSVPTDLGPAPAWLVPAGPENGAVWAVWAVSVSPNAAAHG